MRPQGILETRRNIFSPAEPVVSSSASGNQPCQQEKEADIYPRWLRANFAPAHSGWLLKKEHQSSLSMLNHEQPWSGRETCRLLGTVISDTPGSWAMVNRGGSAPSMTHERSATPERHTNQRRETMATNSAGDPSIHSRHKRTREGVPGALHATE